jgi:tripartite-type tricarboxylate transporter receptor subunit TctC
MIGAGQVAKVAADGSTIVLMTNSNVVNQYLQDNVSYDVQRDFAPISLLVWAPRTLIKSPQLPVTTLSELVTYAKANPGTLSYGSSGVGSLQHISGEMLRRGTSIDIVHVPYRGTAPSFNDLMAGRLPLIVATTVSTLPLIQAGKIEAIATADSKRSPVLPNVPSYKESGFEYPGYDLAISSGIAAPVGTPPEIIGKLGREIQAVAAEPEFRKRLEDLGYTVVAGTPDEYVKQVVKDVELFSRVIPELKAGSK